jgi:hypothetical protein
MTPKLGLEQAVANNDNFHQTFLEVRAALIEKVKAHLQQVFDSPPVEPPPRKRRLTFNKSDENSFEPAFFLPVLESQEPSGQGSSSIHGSV